MAEKEGGGDKMFDSIKARLLWCNRLLKHIFLKPRGHS